MFLELTQTRDRSTDREHVRGFDNSFLNKPQNALNNHKPRRCCCCDVFLFKTCVVFVRMNSAQAPASAEWLSTRFNRVNNCQIPTTPRVDCNNRPGRRAGGAWWGVGLPQCRLLATSTTAVTTGPATSITAVTTGKPLIKP